jgi:MazG C-terminal domain/Nucleotide modification associated domain 2
VAIALHSYIVRYDSAFAPNPFYGVSTLATCKPGIRKAAQIGDWVVGTGSGDRKIRRAGFLVHAMRITEVTDFEHYSTDPRFRDKQPMRRGSRKQSCGDNIYFRTEADDGWLQRDSFHSNDDGTLNQRHVNRDTGVNRVLISTDFVYFGGEGPSIPPQFRDYAGFDICQKGVGRKKVVDEDLIVEFVAWLSSLGDFGYRGSSLMDSRANSASIRLADYAREIEPTDKLPAGDLKPVLLGLFGEVGGIMTTAKKLHREATAFVGYRKAVVEEFGDTLWYFATLCRRLKLPLEDVLAAVTKGAGYSSVTVASDLADVPIAHVASATASLPLDETLLKLGEAAAALMRVDDQLEQSAKLIHQFGDCYIQALQVSGVIFADVVQTNLRKAQGRFLEPDPATLPVFDSDFLDEERLPMEFEIEISQRKSGQSYLRWNGVFIGDPLTDNILDPDGYRFHDVFHFAHAAILHWSPTTRALIKQKRKSDRKFDEAQDGGRAIVVEEGLTAWIFSRAKELDFFEGQNSVSFDLLKTVGEFVRGYEVADCPLKLWERAILEGYAVFRQIRQNNGGIVVGNRTTREIRYRPLEVAIT